MLQCVECGTEINSSDAEMHPRIECPLCGIELELFNKTLIGLQLGPSEE